MKSSGYPWLRSKFQESLTFREKPVSEKQSNLEKKSETSNKQILNKQTKQTLSLGKVTQLFIVDQKFEAILS